MSTLLEKASLVMIPSGYKEDVVYSQIPTNGNGDLTFTRASDGTRVNSQGLVERVPWNLAQYSEDFTNGFWTKNNCTVTANNTTAPNGTTTADLITSTSTSETGVFYIPAVNGTNTWSVYAKKGTGRYLAINANNPLISAKFDLQDGVLVGTPSTGATPSIESVGNGWYRCILTSSTATNRFTIFITNNTTTTDFSSSVGLSYYLWGAQLNIGSTAKPYFPTTDRLNVPRLTYPNGGGGCPSLLLEPQRTNLAFPSEDLTALVSGGMTNTANQTISPDGTQNADKSTIGSTTRFYDVVVNPTVTTVNGTVYTTSFFAKKGTGIEGIYFYQPDGNRIAKFNLNNGEYIGYAPTNGYSAFTSYSSESFGNGWYRFSATYTASGTSGQYVVGVSTNTNDSVTQIAGNGTDFVYVWGLQYEAGSYPTSYIPTTSATVTRVADACSKTGISSLIGQTEGTLFAEINANTTGEDQNIELGNGTSANRINLRLNSNNNYQLVIVQGGVVVFNEIASATFIQGQRIKLAAVYKSGDVTQLFVNGVSVLSATAGTITGSLSAIFTYLAGSGLAYMNSPVNELILFPTALTDTEAINLTTI